MTAERRGRRMLVRFALGAAIVIALAAAPILYVETQCRAQHDATSPPRSEIGDPKFLRAVGDSYLSYPEWYIVHAYEDLAGVIRKSSESGFDYLASIAGFWKTACRTTQFAERVGPVSLDQRITNYIIGESFSAEMLVTGAWERSIGALSVAARGSQRVPEDEIALQVADDYAAFLHQTPWYRYPFGSKLTALWRDVPIGQGSWIRSVERRVALTLEYGGKALYAKALGALAGASPADLRIRTIVEGIPVADLAADPRIVVIGPASDGATIIETDRYQALTKILKDLAGRGGRFRELAGNRRILTTMLAPADAVPDLPGTEVFSLPLQSRPDLRRIGLDTPVGDLARQMADAPRKGATVEHAYDY